MASGTSRRLPECEVADSAGSPIMPVSSSPIIPVCTLTARHLRLDAGLAVVGEMAAGRMDVQTGMIGK